MYRIASKNIFAGYADSVVPIRYHPDGFYILCEEAESEGFCAKMAVTLTDEDGKEYQALSDTVFRFAGKLLKGTEPEGSYEENLGFLRDWLRQRNQWILDNLP